MKLRSCWGNVLLFVLPPVLFLSATLPNLALPGIQYDEVYYVPPAAALLKQQYDMDYVQIDPAVVHLFGRPLPLMFNYYTGFVRAYASLPVFALFGINAATIRGSSIAWATLALMFFIAFTRRLLKSEGVACAAGIFLALDASLVAYAHNDFAAVSLMMFFKGAGLWALLRWWQHPQLKRLLYAGAFFFGLGLSDRASFLWLPMALAPALALSHGKSCWLELKRRLQDFRTAGLAAGTFAVGAALFIAFNAATLGGTFTPMAGSFRSTSGGADNLDFFGNLHLRLQMLTEVLGGGYLDQFILGDMAYQTSSWHFSGSPLSWLVPLAFFYFAVRALRNRLKHRSSDRALVFLLVMTAGLLILTCFTPTLHRGHQLLMLYPFPHILAALLLFEIAAWLRRQWPRLFQRSEKRLIAAFVVCIGLASARPVLAYHHLLQQTGGRGVWSNAIYDIVAEADRHHERTMVCMDWGFNAQLLALTAHPVRTIRNYETTRRSSEQLAQLFDASHVFLLHAPEYTYVPGAREDFFAAVHWAGAQIDTLRVFHQREGQPVAYMVRVKRQGQDAQ